jgi:hypothetical protein
MLSGVRTELLARIDQVREEVVGVKADVEGVRADVAGVRAELAGVRAELKADIASVKADIAAVKAGVARVEVLVEEQHARNQIVLDGIAALMSRQDQVEERVGGVEETVPRLASA